VASEAPPERGNLQIQVATPLPPSLGYRLREGTLSLKGRGEESAWLGHIKLACMNSNLDIGQ
jgi:hypothetical protein